MPFAFMKCLWIDVLCTLCLVQLINHLARHLVLGRFTLVFSSNLFSVYDMEGAAEIALVGGFL